MIQLKPIWHSFGNKEKKWIREMRPKLTTAMIIDDDNDLSQILACILEDRKIHVMIVPTLQEAEGYLDHLKPTLIFLDNSFPDGLGVNFIKSIKEADSEIKVIMMTGDDASWIKEKAISEGVDYFIKKPFTMKIIDKALSAVEKVNMEK